GDGLGDGVILDALTGQPSPFDPTDGMRQLKVYATGARNAPFQISVVIGGRLVPFESITHSAQTPGVDEIFFQLPRDLRGAGAVNLSVRAARRDSNPVNLTIAGEFSRDIFINEALADPPDGIAGDANHDGVRSGTDDEFIELVNAQADDVNISGWTVKTRAVGGTTETTRHVFAAGTVIPAHDALVIFGGGSFNPNHPAFGGARVIAASTAGGLSLTNAGLTILIRNAAGNLITEFSYGGATGLDGNANQSLTRAPDVSGNFMLHTQAAGAFGRAFSPGTLLDGTFFAPRTGHLSSVSLAPASRNCFTGQQAQFTAKAFDQFNRPLRFLNFAFDLSNPSAAMVEAVRVDRRTGIVTATLRCTNAGTTELRATATDGISALTSTAVMLNVTTAPPVISRVEVSPDSSIVNRGNTQQFTARAFDASNQEISGVAFVWSSSNSEIATVDANGLARGAGLGSAAIIATTSNGMGGNVSGQAILSVRVPLVINEILGDVPPDNLATPAIEGDANRDGARDSGDDEFLELFNNSAQPVDISGIIIADATGNRYIFPQNTILSSGRAVIIFGGGSPPINDPAFGGSMMVTASSLGLNDTGDTVQVKIPLGGTELIIASITYG
ncbi:MAG: lamin tail domain-containing protein, partial [Pyrinomonadaceae bacterium]|nr:lamin tail domain-containing protein [Pyrinomonadaceae bacterium]